MKYNDLNKAINKKINKKNIFTKEDMIDYCKLLANFKSSIYIVMVLRLIQL